MRNIRFIVTILAVFVLFAATAIGQITVNFSNFPAVGSSFMTYSSGTVTIDLGNTGPNQTWDFTGYEFYEDGFTQIVDPSTTAFSASFSSATHAFSVLADPVVGYAYVRVEGDALYELGYAGTAEGQSLTLQYNPAALASPLPMTYQSAWTTVVRFSRVVAGRTVTYVDSTLNLADAWGNVLTETEIIPALRVQEHTYSIVSAPPVPPQTTQAYSYRFVMENGFCGADVTNAEGTANPNFTQAIIDATLSSELALQPARGPVAEGFAVGQNYPNPFNPLTTLPVEIAKSGRVEVSIYDETGRLVSAREFDLSPGRHDLSVDGSPWSSGVYFARVTNESQNSTVRMQLLK